MGNGLSPARVLPGVVVDLIRLLINRPATVMKRIRKFMLRSIFTWRALLTAPIVIAIISVLLLLVMCVFFGAYSLPSLCFIILLLVASGGSCVSIIVYNQHVDMYPPESEEN